MFVYTWIPLLCVSLTASFPQDIFPQGQEFRYTTRSVKHTISSSNQKPTINEDSSKAHSSRGSFRYQKVLFPEVTDSSSPPGLEVSSNKNSINHSGTFSRSDLLNDKNLSSLNDFPDFNEIIASLSLPSGKFASKKAEPPIPWPKSETYSPVLNVENKNEGAHSAQSQDGKYGIQKLTTNNQSSPTKREATAVNQIRTNFDQDLFNSIFYSLNSGANGQNINSLLSSGSSGTRQNSQAGEFQSFLASTEDIHTDTDPTNAFGIGLLSNDRISSSFGNLQTSHVPITPPEITDNQSFVTVKLKDSDTRNNEVILNTNQQEGIPLPASIADVTSSNFPKNNELSIILDDAGHSGGGDVSFPTLFQPFPIPDTHPSSPQDSGLTIKVDNDNSVPSINQQATSFQPFQIPDVHQSSPQNSGLTIKLDNDNSIPSVKPQTTSFQQYPIPDITPSSPRDSGVTIKLDDDNSISSVRPKPTSFQPFQIPDTRPSSPQDSGLTIKLDDDNSVPSLTPQPASFQPLPIPDIASGSTQDSGLTIILDDDASAFSVTPKPTSFQPFPIPDITPGSPQDSGLTIILDDDDSFPSGTRKPSSFQPFGIPDITPGSPQGSGLTIKLDDDDSVPSGRPKPSSFQPFGIPDITPGSPQGSGLTIKLDDDDSVSSGRLKPTSFQPLPIPDITPGSPQGSGLTIKLDDDDSVSSRRPKPTSFQPFGIPDITQGSGLTIKLDDDNSFPSVNPVQIQAGANKGSQHQIILDTDENSSADIDVLSDLTLGELLMGINGQKGIKVLPMSSVNKLPQALDSGSSGSEVQIKLDDDPDSIEVVLQPTTTTTAAPTTRRRASRRRTTTKPPAHIRMALSDLLYAKGQWFGTLLGGLIDLGRMAKEAFKRNSGNRHRDHYH